MLISPELLNFHKNKVFLLIQYDHCSFLFTPRHFPFSCLTTVTLQNSAKLWATVDGESNSGIQYFWLFIMSKNGNYGYSKVFFYPLQNGC